MTPRELLIRLRAVYDDPTRLRRWITFAGVVLAVTFVAGVLIDVLAPFSILFNFLRTFVMIPSAVSLFVLMYFYSIKLHLYQVRQDPDWQPYRTRFSPTWRRRLAAIVTAVLVVMLYGVGQGPGYTFMSTVFLVIGFALFAFIRTTKQEESRERYGIPDPRDVRYRKLSKTSRRQKTDGRQERKND